MELHEAQMLKLVVLLLCLVSYSFANVEIRWGISKELFYYHKIAKAFKEKIEKTTNGRVNVNIILYDDVTQEVGTENSLKSEKYHIHQSFTGEFAHIRPELKVWDVPFLFRDDRHVEKYFVSKKAKANLAHLESELLLPIDYTFAGGYQFIYSRDKFESFAQLKNQNFKSFDVYGFGSKFLKYLNVHVQSDVNEPTTANPVGEIFGSGVIELTSKKEFKNYFINITNHRLLVRILFVSKKLLAKLEPSDSKLLVSELKKMALIERKLSTEGKNLNIKLLENRGANVVHWTDHQKRENSKLFQPITEEYRAQIGHEIEFIESL